MKIKVQKLNLLGGRRSHGGSGPKSSQMAPRICTVWVKKERIQYEQLSAVQWVADYCRILREEKDPHVREHILDFT